jgi:hypothetical protein
MTSGGAAEAAGVCPGVAVKEMHRKRMLEQSWCNDLMQKIKIPLEAIC